MWWQKFKNGTRKVTGIWILTVMILTGALSCPATETEKKIPEELKNLYARSAVLMDGDSGRVLFGKNEKEVLPMASTTKILTCILALELGQPEEICAVSEKAAAQPKVHLGMRAGETYYLKDLLYSLMLESHNDTAVCVAEQIGGSVEQFAELMNQKAKEIGCEQAHFVTPNGLDGRDEGGDHCITATDLGLLMRYCIMESEKKEEFLEITGTANYTFQDVAGKRSFSCTNHNALLSSMEGALSGKTGFTSKAGYCYVGAVRREEKTLIVVLLACGWPNNRNYKWTDTKKMMEYGFAHYEKKWVDLSRVALPSVKVVRGVEEQVQVELEGEASPLKKTLLGEPEKELYVRIQCAPILEAPVEKKQKVGKLQVLLGEELLEEYSLVSENGVKKITYWFCLQQIWQECLF